MIDISWKIGGEAGFGIMTSGLTFSKVFTRMGYYIFDSSEYPSLIRGGHNSYIVRIKNEPVSTQKKEIDILVCLNKETLDKNLNFLNKKSIVIYDEKDFKIENANFQSIKVNLPLKDIIQKFNASIVMKNTVALGASLRLLHADINILLNLIEEEFKKKGDQVIKFNQDVALAGYKYIEENYLDLLNIFQIKNKKDKVDKLVLTGNDAFSLGSIVADCRLYVAYPMTPSSSVLSTLASWQDKTGIIVRHAEDEISVINTAIGASFAGVRAAVGTSGGGFALMVETISLAGITETPLVIFLSQRPGPATGMPTWTEQGDLLFAIFSGHGEFLKIVLTPGDGYEMIDLTLKAYNLADIYQTPVIIISDKFLSESHYTVDKNEVDELINNYKVNRGKLVLNIENKNKQIKPFLRYQLTEDGISPRLLPGIKGCYYQANSYEHLEDGHTTEESLPRKQQVDKRNKKIVTYLKNDFQLPNYYGDKDAELIFISWGSNKGVILEVQKILKEKNIKTGFYHFSHVYPLDRERIKKIFLKEKNYVLVENNSWGQFGKLLAMKTGFEFKYKILKYDGREIMVDDILRELEGYELLVAS